MPELNAAPAGTPAPAKRLLTTDYDYLTQQQLADAPESKSADVASAATTDIAAATAAFLHITGTTTITAFTAAQAGTRRRVVFDGALTLTHNGTSLILPTGANITTAAGDCVVFISEGGGANWRCVGYMRADGTALAGTGVSADWGDIGGTLADQTDLQAALDAKAELTALAADSGAALIGYDNATSGLAATDVQAAIDELEAATGGVSSVNGDSGAVVVLVPIGIACSDETTNLTIGTDKATIHLPRPYTLVSPYVMGELSTVQSAGSIFTVDVNESGVSILSTKLTIDNGEETSLTAATPPVCSDTALAAGAKITVDIDQVGTAAAKGLKVWLIGYWTP